MIINMSTNTAVMIWKAVENFSEHLKASFSFTKHHFFKLFEWPDRVSVGIKTEKLPIAHVFDNNIVLKHCMTILFACED